MRVSGLPINKINNGALRRAIRQILREDLPFFALPLYLCASVVGGRFDAITLARYALQLIGRAQKA